MTNGVEEDAEEDIFRASSVPPLPPPQDVYPSGGVDSDGWGGVRTTPYRH